MEQLFLFETDDDPIDKEEIISDQSTKICRICHIEKSIDDFHLDRGSPYSKCKDCFGEYQKILRKIKKNAPAKPENGKCECCGKIVTKWVCDHYPNTEIFRGWVCGDCNVASGLMGDSYEGSIKLFNYLWQRKR
jgi:hypothetical protein